MTNKPDPRSPEVNSPAAAYSNDLFFGYAIYLQLSGNLVGYMRNVKMILHSDP